MISIFLGGRFVYAELIEFSCGDAASLGKLAS